MAFADKLKRLSRLVGIVGISLGSLVAAACSGSTKLDGESDLRGEAGDSAEDEAAVGDAADAGEDVRGEEEVRRDAREEEPETDLWDVICE